MKIWNNGTGTRASLILPGVTHFFSSQSQATIEYLQERLDSAQEENIMLKDEMEEMHRGTAVAAGGRGAARGTAAGEDEGEWCRS